MKLKQSEQLTMGEQRDAFMPVAYANGDQLDNMLDDREAIVSSRPTGWRQTALYSAGQVRGMIYNAVLAERHACSIAVWMTLMDALAPDADDKGLDGWMREAEARVKARDTPCATSHEQYRWTK
jgi:hypothetical protein